MHILRPPLPQGQALYCPASARMTLLPRLPAPLPRRCFWRLSVGQPALLVQSLRQTFLANAWKEAAGQSFRCLAFAAELLVALIATAATDRSAGLAALHHGNMFLSEQHPLLRSPSNRGRRHVPPLGAAGQHRQRWHKCEAALQTARNVE